METQLEIRKNCPIYGVRSRKNLRLLNSKRETRDKRRDQVRAERRNSSRSNNYLRRSQYLISVDDCEPGRDILDNTGASRHYTSADVFLEQTRRIYLDRKSKHPSSYPVTSMKIAGKHRRGKIWYSNWRVREHENIRILVRYYNIYIYIQPSANSISDNATQFTSRLHWKVWTINPVFKTLRYLIGCACELEQCIDFVTTGYSRARCNYYFFLDSYIILREFSRSVLFPLSRSRRRATLQLAIPLYPRLHSPSAGRERERRRAQKYYIRYRYVARSDKGPSEKGPADSIVFRSDGIAVRLYFRGISMTQPAKRTFSSRRGCGILSWSLSLFVEKRHSRCSRRIPRVFSGVRKQKLAFGTDRRLWQSDRSAQTRLLQKLFSYLGLQIFYKNYLRSLSSPINF